MPLPLAIGAALGTAYQLGTGISQMVQAGKARRRYDELQANRPQYERPGEVNRNLGLATARVGDPGFAGESAMRDRSELNAANTAALAGAGGDPFAAAIAAQGQLEAAQRETTGMGENIRLQNERDLSQALLTSAQYTDREFQMNEFAPWLDAVGEAQLRERDNRQGGLRNIGNALGNISMMSLGTMMQGGLGASEGIPYDQDAMAQILSKYGGMAGAAGSAAAGVQPGAQPQGGIDWAGIFQQMQALQNRPR